METTDGRTPAGADGDGPSLVVVCGVPGVGKSRVAREIADCLSATVYRTDEIRATLSGDPTYDSEETERVYATVRDRAIATIERGGRAVLDGTYRDESFRADLVAAADRLDVDPVFVKVECPEHVVRERIDARTDDASDAGFAEYRHIREHFDALSREHVTVDNSGDWSRTRQHLCVAFPGF